MRGRRALQVTIWAFVDLEEPVSADHPLCAPLWWRCAISKPASQLGARPRVGGGGSASGSEGRRKMEQLATVLSCPLVKRQDL